MRAAVWHNRRDVRIEEVDSPPMPPQHRVQVKVSWCCICGTDLHEYLSGPIYVPVGRPHPLTGVQAPVIVGHEMSGEVVAVGEGVQDLTPGDSAVACCLLGTSWSGSADTLGWVLLASVRDK